MARYSELWKNCIRALLKDEGITVEEAAARSAASPAYWGEWRRVGRVPEYTLAKTALSAFLPTNRDRVIDCIRAADYPVPPEWQESSNTDLAQVILDAFHLRGQDIPPEGQEQIRDLIDEIVAANQKKREGGQ